MTARDLFHTAVRRALEKDGWLITHDPLRLTAGGAEFYIDLGAEYLLAAEKDTRKIAVEIKSFTGGSAIHEFHTALGQFLNYQLMLRGNDPDRQLYLAVPDYVFDTMFSLPFVQQVIKEFNLNLIVYVADGEEIVKWIPLNAIE